MSGLFGALGGVFGAAANAVKDNVATGNLSGAFVAAQQEMAKIDMPNALSDISAGAHETFAALREQATQAGVDAALAQVAAAVYGTYFAAREGFEEHHVKEAIVNFPVNAQNFATEHGPVVAGKIKDWIQAHPVATVVIIMAAAAVLFPRAYAIPILGALGLGSRGIAAGSSAAAIQSGIRSVVTPGLFASLQSVGAGGSGAAQVFRVVQGIEAIRIVSTITSTLNYEELIGYITRGLNGGSNGNAKLE